MKTYTVREAVVAVVVILVVGVAGYAWFHSANSSHVVTAMIQRGSIVQEVLASGNVEAPTTLDLQFQTGGRLVYIGVKTGDTVHAGDVLAREDSSVLQAQLAQAQASVDAQTALLASLQAGTRPEQIAVTQTLVGSDEIALAQSQVTVRNAIQNAYSQSDDAIRNKSDQFFDNARSANPQTTFASATSQSAGAIESERVSMETMLSVWQKDIQIMGTSSAALAAAASEAQANLAAVSTFLTDANDALNSAIPTTQVSTTVISGYITAVATARVNVNAAITTLTTAVAGEQSAEAALLRDEKNLALEEAGSTTEEIQAQVATVAQTQAAVAAIRAQIAQAILVAPVDGTVTDVSGDVGETVSPATVVVSLIPASKLQINANVSEDNIADVQVGDPVRITLDAFGGAAEWQGTVAEIDPAQTTLGGAVYYKTKIILSQSDKRIKPGMTANVWIETGSTASALLVPASAISTNGTTTFVQVYQNGTVLTQSVSTGLKSRTGMVEITSSGLIEGQEVVTGGQ